MIFFEVSVGILNPLIERVARRWDLSSFNALASSSCRVSANSCGACLSVIIATKTFSRISVIKFKVLSCTWNPTPIFAGMLSEAVLRNKLRSGLLSLVSSFITNPAICTGLRPKNSSSMPPKPLYPSLACSSVFIIFPATAIGNIAKLLICTLQFSYIITKSFTFSVSPSWPGLASSAPFL